MLSKKARDPARGRPLLFSLSTCAHCRAAKKILDDQGLAFETLEVDLLPEPEKAEALERLGRHNPALTFPTLAAGSRVAAGPLPEDFRRAARKFLRR